MKTPEYLEDLENIWKSCEPAEHTTRTLPIMLACQLGDSIRRLESLIKIEGVDYALVNSEEKRAIDIRAAIDANQSDVCDAIRNYYSTMFKKTLEPKDAVFNNLPYFCRKISIFINGECPPW